MQLQIIVVLKFPQGLPHDIQAVLTDKNIENGPKALHSEFSFLQRGLFRMRIVAGDDFFPGGQVAIDNGEMIGLSLKAIQFQIRE